MFKFYPLFLLFGLMLANSSSQAYNDGDLVLVGKERPIELPFRDPKTYESLASKIGSRAPILGRGEGIVYANAGCPEEAGYGARCALKVMAAQMLNGDEIRALKIAAEQGVGPKYYTSWVTTDENGELYAMMLMEELIGENLANLLPLRVKSSARGHDFLLTETAKIFHYRTKDLNDQDTYFWDRFFQMLLLLAEKNISYTDTHWGNLMAIEQRYFRQYKEHLFLVDFGGAKVHANPAEAAQATINGNYPAFLILRFTKSGAHAPVAKQRLARLLELSKEQEESKGEEQPQ